VDEDDVVGLLARLVANDRRTFDVEDTRALLAVAGRKPSKVSAIVVVLEEHNDGLEVARVLLHHLDLALGETNARIEEIDWTAKFLVGPLAIGGISVFTLGALSAIGVLGTGGAALVAIGGMVMFGGASIGLVKMMRERSHLHVDRGALEAMRQRLVECQAELRKRRGS
jgi:hypothetical protein